MLSPSFWRVLAVWGFFGLYEPHPSPCLHVHMAFCLCASVSKCPYFIRIWVRLDSGLQCDLLSTNRVCIYK